MPNWCYTTMRITGEGVTKINKAIKLCEKKYLHENGFGKFWLGNLLIALGENWETYPCRGVILDFKLFNDTLSISYESAWSPCFELMGLLRKQYNVEIEYIATEPGCCVYETNNQLVAEKYVNVDYSDENKDIYRNEEIHKDRVKAFCREISDGVCRNLDELRVYAEREGATLSVDEYEYFDDF